jgi:hypothetical protein
VQAQNREIGLIELHRCNSTLDHPGILVFFMNLVALVGLSSPELLRSFSRPTIIAVIQVNQSRSEISIPNLAN